MRLNACGMVSQRPFLLHIEVKMALVGFSHLEKVQKLPLEVVPAPPFPQLFSRIVPAKSTAPIAYTVANVAKLLVRPDKRRTLAATASAATVSPKWQLQTTS
jgi:hypothetical protein